MSDPAPLSDIRSAARQVVPDLLLPRRSYRPLTAIAIRIGAAVAVLLFVAAVVFLGRDGYVDTSTGEQVTFLDAVYYASVSVTTTGYGDIIAVTPGTRLASALLITPARVAFLILVVSTTVEVLTERTRDAINQSRRRRRMRDHVVICGFGTKGRGAAATLEAQGCDPEEIVVVDPDREACEEARLLGYTAVPGSAVRTAVLRHAGVAEARAVVVVTHTDATAVLTTLTARELNPSATIVAAVRESENVHLLEQSGANTVITSAEAAGRLLGLATSAPEVVAVLEDLLVVGEGLEVIERDPHDHEIGGAPSTMPRRLAVAIIRDGKTIPFNNPEFSQVRATDRVVCLSSDGEVRSAEPGDIEEEAATEAPAIPDPEPETERED